MFGFDFWFIFYFIKNNHLKFGKEVGISLNVSYQYKK